MRSICKTVEGPLVFEGQKKGPVKLVLRGLLEPSGPAAEMLRVSRPGLACA